MPLSIKALIIALAIIIAFVVIWTKIRFKKNKKRPG